MNVGSLFSGIGGLELGLERAGMKVAWQVEKDDFCRKVLAKHWPDVRSYEDVREVGADELEPVDLICGGFPCTDISVAGKGEGLDGAESGLWFEFARIIRELRPRYVLVENVSALTIRGLDQVLGCLAEIGYDAEWTVLPATEVGAPHRRERVFIVAYPNGEQFTSLFVDGGSKRGDTPSSAGSVDTMDKGRRTGVRSGSEHWLVEPDVGRVADGPTPQVDRLRALGNAVVPQVSEWIGRRIMEAG